MRGRYVECQDGHMTLTISWSQLRLFEECRQKVSLLRAGKRQHAANARVFFPGTVVDRVVRDWLTNGAEPGAMPDMVSSVMVREKELLASDENRIVKWKDLDDEAAVREDCIQAVRNIEPALVKYVLPYEYQTDYRFRTPIDLPYQGGKVRALLIGAMDIVVHDPDAGWWANYDVKMTRDENYWKKTQGQMTFYDLASELEHGQPTRASALFQPMCEKQIKVIPTPAAKRQEMLAHIVQFSTAVLNEDMPMTLKRSDCVYCDFKHACPRFKPVLNASGKKTISF